MSVIVMILDGRKFNASVVVCEISQWWHALMLPGQHILSCAVRFLLLL